MHTVLVQRGGGPVEQAGTVDPRWLEPDAPEVVWVDIEAPTEADRALLADVFGFHELAVEDALSEIHYPKIETYPGLLYLILHGIRPCEGGFETQDVDFLIGRNYLVTVHRGPSRSIAAERQTAVRRPELFAEGPMSICQRIVHHLVDHYGPEVDRLEACLEAIETEVFDHAGPETLRELLRLKRDVAALRRVTLPQRDAVARLARRELPEISEALGYRFRDVFDQLVRLSEEAMLLQDRATGLVDAYLSNQSNRLNQVMKILTIISTIFMPLTVLTGIWGMNVALPVLPGGPEAQIWWVIGLMGVLAAAMLLVFRRLRWL